MIKIRLHGEPNEITTAVKAIEENFEILAKSDFYSDRGESKYKRVYLDCRLLDLDEYMEKHPGAYVQGGGIESE